MLVENAGKAGTLEELPFINEDQFNRYRFFCADNGVVLPIQLKIKEINDRTEKRGDLVAHLKEFNFHPKQFLFDHWVDSIAIFNDGGIHLLTSKLAYNQWMRQGDNFILTYNVCVEATEELSQQDVEQQMCENHFNLVPLVGMNITIDGKTEFRRYGRVDGK